jgi:hypothetical protein
MDHVSSNAQALTERADFVRQQVGPARRAIASVPFLLLALAPLLAFTTDVVLRSFILSVIAIFTVHMPIVASAYGLHGDEQSETPLPRAAYLWLLLLWATTNWALCLLWQ